MKKLYKLPILLSVLTVLILTPLLNAQVAPSPPSGEDDRCWGMNFMWKRDFTVGKQKIDEFNFNPSTPEDERVTGFGLDYYLGPKSSLNLIGSLGIGSDEIENTSGKEEFSATELGIRLGYNIYPYGMDKPVYFSVGPWASFVSYSETQEFTPTTGETTKDEFSASRLGFGVNASAYLKPWKDLDWEFYAGYNVGAFITPESTYKQTVGGQTTELNGPSSFHLQDCGGFVGTRLFFR